MGEDGSVGKRRGEALTRWEEEMGWARRRWE
jgi:hypothetical protein